MIWVLLALFAGHLVHLQFETEAGCREVAQILETQQYEARCFPVKRDD